jgi:hypothetical protein
MPTVDARLDDAQDLQPDLPDLGFQPRCVVSTHRVMVRDRRAGPNDRGGRGGLGGGPLRQRIVALRGHHREVERGTGGVHVGDVAEHDRRRPLRRKGIGERVTNGVVQGRHVRPERRRLQGFGEDADVEQRVAQVRAAKRSAAHEALLLAERGRAEFDENRGDRGPGGPTSRRCPYPVIAKQPGSGAIPASLAWPG